MIEDKEDFFEQVPEDQPKKEKPPKEPHYRHDDPRYYEKEEGQWEHLKPSPYNRGPIVWITLLVVLAVAIFIGFYVYLFTPEVEEATEFGYVENVQKEGKFIKTYEGVILPYKQIMDMKRGYEGDFIFSAKNDSIAAKLKYQQRTGKPVRVDYEIYRVRLPWRGNSKVIVTSVDSVDPATILPPERQPEWQKQ